MTKDFSFSALNVCICYMQCKYSACLHTVLFTAVGSLLGSFSVNDSRLQLFS